MINDEKGNPLSDDKFLADDNKSTPSTTISFAYTTPSFISTSKIQQYRNAHLSMISTTEKSFIMQDIDSKINSNFAWFSPLLWFILILSILATLTSAIWLYQYGPLSLFILTLVMEVTAMIGIIIGINARNETNIEKNQLFEYILIANITFLVVSLIWSYVHLYSDDALYMQITRIVYLIILIGALIANYKLGSMLKVKENMIRVDLNDEPLQLDIKISEVKKIS